MIRALRLGNFKAFAETQLIPMRPITLVYGPNSAGKSSIIHSLALTHHAILTGDLDTQRTEIGGESIDLGGFRQYVHRRDASRRVEWTIELDTDQLTGRLGELLAPARRMQLAMTVGMGEFDETQPTIFGGFTRVHGPRVAIESCVVLADDRPLVTMSARRGGLLRIDRLDQQAPVFRELLKAIVLSTTTTEEVREEDFAGIDEAVDALVPDLIVRLGRFLPYMDARLSTEQETMQTLLFPIGKGDRRESLVQAVRMFLPRSLRELINGISAAVENAIGRLHYLGPLRSYPPRHLAFSAHHDPNWHAGGGSSWDVLRRDAVVRAAVNRWLSSPERLSTPYEVVVRDLVALDQLDVPLREAVERLNEDDENERDRSGSGAGLGDGTGDGSGSGSGYGNADGSGYGDGRRPVVEDVDEEVLRFKATLQEADIDRFTELVLVDRRRNTVVSHRDVGIGVSQVLPVLVNAFGLREQLIAIEQPEIHLHPALQAELGDVFIDSALGERKNTFLLETHSEHLVLRILRRVRETSEGTSAPGATPIHASDVSLLYVDPQGKGTGSRVISIGLTPDGEFAQRWPNGFFAERAQELM
ncbi:MAG: AAA family ATPase [Candidatus Wallbacteria bacterium]|nr:AAA family ATPase [Candidatus Wallbacteria bacterium]